MPTKNEPDNPLATKAELADSVEKGTGLLDQLTFMIQSSRDAILRMNEKGEILTWNRAAETLFGWTAEEALGKPVTDLMAPEGVSKAHAQGANPAVHAGTAKDPMTGKTIELSAKHKDGHEFPVELSLSEARFGEQLNAVGIVRDVSRRKEEERSLRLQNETLAKINRFSIELSMLSSEEDLESYIAKRIKDLTGAKVATISEYDPENRTITPLHIEMEPGLAEKIVGLLGNQIKKIKSPVSDELYREMTRDIIGSRGTLHEMSFGAIPRPVGAAVEAILKANRFIGLAYLIEGKLYGTSVLAMGKDQPDPPRELLESLISVASVSLRRKRAEEHEKKQGEFMKTVLNSLQSPLYVVDKGFNVVLGNEAAKKRGIVDGGQCHRVAHQTEKTCNDTHVCPLKEVVRTGKSMMAEHLHTDKDGNAKTFEVHGDPIFGKDGEVVQMIEYSIDVTERKKMEEDLRESEKRFRELAELLPETVFETDPKGTLTFANRKAFDHFGYAPEELAKGLNVLDLVAPEDRKRAFENMQNVMNGETLGLNEFTMVRKSGSRFPSTIHSTAILKGGNPSGLRGFVMDITSRKTMEAALKESEQKFRDIFMHSPDPISIHATEDGKCVEINAAFTQLSGHSQNEAMGRTTAELELWENPDDRLRFLERMRKEGEVKNMETVFLTKDGTEKPCLISAYLIDLQGKKHIVSMVKDLSDLRRVEREKESIRKQLIQSQKMEMIGQLAGGIAHDFNNILTVIGGNSDIGMESTSPNDPLHEFFREILNASKNASSLTRKLLAFSRQQHLREERVNLKEIFPGLEKMLKRIIGEDIKPSFSANPDLWAIKIDPSQLENVIINLAINARDGINERRQSRRDEKTPPKPFVGILAVSAHNCALDKAEADTMPDMLPGPHVRIDVEDNGCGISEENLQKIFTPFFTTKAVGKGTGLGLASVMGTVLQSRGGIQVRSTVGEGTRFSMFFPRLQEATPAPAALPGKKEALKSSKTILLVEDDESVGKSTQRMLEQFGHTVLLANDPNEALSLFDKRSDEIDLIISDMKMPHLTGPELVELVRTKKPVKVLFMSGYPEEHFNKGEGTNDEFIAKPFGVSDLSKKLQGIFDEKDKK